MLSGKKSFCIQGIASSAIFMSKNYNQLAPVMPSERRKCFDLRESVFEFEPVNTLESYFPRLLFHIPCTCFPGIFHMEGIPNSYTQDMPQLIKDPSHQIKFHQGLCPSMHTQTQPSVGMKIALKACTFHSK